MIVRMSGILDFIYIHVLFVRNEIFQLSTACNERVVC